MSTNNITKENNPPNSDQTNLNLNLSPAQNTEKSTNKSKTPNINPSSPQSSSSNLTDVELEHITIPKKTPWKNMTHSQRFICIYPTLLRILILLICFYFFLLGMKLLSSSFKIISGKSTKKLFSFADNPITGLMIGMFVTMLLQSSSTTTSITVGLVAGGILSVRHAIPIIMGANIGTSITNTLVSLAHIRNAKEFELAFSAAIVHDIFNYLAVLAILPLELLIRVITKKSGPLEALSSVLVEPLKGGTKLPNPVDLMIKPFANLFIYPNKCLISVNSLFHPINDPKNFFEACVRDCGKKICPNTALSLLSSDYDYSICDACNPKSFSLVLGGVFSKINVNDTIKGVIVLIIALIFIIVSLLSIVKCLSSLLKGVVSVWIKKALGYNVYLAMFISAIMTVFVQSSSIITSSFVPLVGIGAILLEQMYPLTLGANLGTTVTSLIAASAEGEFSGLQIALCHFFFNFFGILIFFPIPILRKIPVDCARYLGKQVRKRKWFGVFYLVFAFIIVPLIIFFSSMNIISLIIVFVLSFLIIGFLCFWRQVRVKCPSKIPIWCPKIMIPNVNDDDNGDNDHDLKNKMSVAVEKSLSVFSSISVKGQLNMV